MTKINWAVLAIACFSFSVQAEENIYSKRYTNCMNKAGGVTVEVHDCIGEESTRQDQKLNKAYKNLISQISVERRKELLTAQRLWIKYRDANCDFYADPDGGSMAGLNAGFCTLETTARRAQELEKLAN